MSAVNLGNRLPRGPIENRFWPRVERRGPDECWLWTGKRNAKGYGVIGRNGRRTIATQISWELAQGSPVPAELLVCHSCDNPPCVNPAHLWLGTNSDNMRDMVAKGRNATAGHPDHCKRGHAYEGQRPFPSEHGIHRCRICHYAAQKLRVARKLEGAAA